MHPSVTFEAHGRFSAEGRQSGSSGTNHVAKRKGWREATDDGVEPTPAGASGNACSNSGVVKAVQVDDRRSAEGSQRNADQVLAPRNLQPLETELAAIIAHFRRRRNRDGHEHGKERLHGPLSVLMRPRLCRAAAGLVGSGRAGGLVLEYSVEPLTAMHRGSRVGTLHYM